MRPAKTNTASLQCFLVHKVTPCGLVTINGGHFHAMAHSSHLLASKVLSEERKCFSNIMRVKYKYSKICIESKDLWKLRKEDITTFFRIFAFLAFAIIMVQRFPVVRKARLDFYHVFLYRLKTNMREN